MAILSMTGIPIRDKEAPRKKIIWLFNNRELLNANKNIKRYEKDDLRQEFSTLFDLAKCKCYIKVSAIAGMTPHRCKCKHEDKITVNNLPFFFHQRNLALTWPKRQ